MAREGIVLKRRGGRWVAARSASGEAVPASSPPLPEHLRQARRAGGRWVASGAHQGTSRLRGWLTACGVLALVAPMGVMWADSSYVRPTIADIDDAGARERARLLDEQDELRIRIDGLNSEHQGISAELDTLHLPLVAFHQQVYDSLLVRRKTQDVQRRITPADLDSLSAMRDALAQQLREVRGSYMNRLSVLNNLDAWGEALRDSMEAIDAQALAMQTPKARATDRPNRLRRVATHLGYVLAPVLGYMWATDS